MATGLTYQQQHKLLDDDDQDLRKRVTVKSEQYAGYLAGLTVTTGFFNAHTQTVYDKMQAFCRRVLLAIANKDTSLFRAITLYWIVVAQSELDKDDYAGTITDARISFFIESDVFLKLSGVTGDEFAAAP